MFGDVNGPYRVAPTEGEIEPSALRHWRQMRCLVRPGMTGPWQANGRSSLPLVGWLRYDVARVEQCSPRLDSHLLWRTVAAMLKGIGAVWREPRREGYVQSRAAVPGSRLFGGRSGAEMPKLVYRPYQPEDAQALCDLHASVFGVVRRPGFWHWKYGANPAGRDLTWVAEDRDTHEIVGVNGLIPIRIGCGGERLVACQSMDIAVREEYRRHLVHIEIAMREMEHVRERREEFAFVFAFGEPVTIKVSAALLGFVPVAPIPRVIRPLSVRSRVPPLLRGAAGPVDALYWSLARPRHAAPPRGATVVRVARFDQRYDRLWEQQAARYPLAVWRDAAYLNWRYLEAPGGGYEAYAMEAAGEVRGFTVLRPVTVAGRRRGRLVELVAVDDDEAIARALLSHALGRCREERLELAAAWVLPTDPRWEVMKGLGFLLRQRQGHEVVVRTVSGRVKPEFAAEPANWRVSWGDADEV